MTEPQLRIRRLGDRLEVQGRVQDNRVHRHRAVQLVLADAPAVLTGPAGQVSGRYVLVRGGIPHQLRMESGRVVLLEPKSPPARLLLSQGRSGIAPIPSSLLSQLEAALDQAARPSDPRIRRTLREIDALEASGRLPTLKLEDVLGRRGLSASRFRHLFTEQVGTPWRSYLVWRRALAALTLASRGASLTDAAHATGYADSAHCSRQVAALFGFTPSLVLQRSRFVQGAPEPRS